MLPYFLRRLHITATPTIMTDIMTGSMPNSGTIVPVVSVDVWFVT